MAVYERSYEEFRGKLTPEWSRFLIIPRNAYHDVFRSKLFIAFFALCFAYPLIAAILIYLHHNAVAIATLKLNVAELLPINGSFFQTFVVVQGVCAFFLNLLVGPPLISRDLTNNALPLYLSRPFSRTEYIVGKMSVVVLLMSAITWVPGLLLFLFQALLEGGGWVWSNLWIASAIVVGSAVWIILLALLSQAISAWVKWRIPASAALIALFFIPQIVAEFVNRLFYTTWGDLFGLNELIRVIWASLFRNYNRNFGTQMIWENGRRVSVTLTGIPVWSAWLMVGILCGLCILLLSRKVKAYEAVRG
jgi:ABC-type transport system involved in multi-copper enzyme maturation permease subunit